MVFCRKGWQGKLLSRDHKTLNKDGFELATTEALHLASWWQSLLESRDQLLANARFQRWAASFPMTRFIARRRAKETFDLVAGFVYSQILLACVRMNVFEILAEKPQTIEDLALRLTLSIESTRRLVDAAISLDLLEQRSRGRYGLGRLGAPLVGNKPIRAMIEHHALLYADLRDPVALLRGERHQMALAGYWPYAEAEQPSALVTDRVAAYTQLMSVSQPLVAGEILDACPLGKYRCLLDVGGGDGSFLITVAQRYPKLNLMLFDLPPVATLAIQKMDAAGLMSRTVVVGGSFLDEPLPAGADIISFVRVIHDHDDASVLRMLRAAREALVPGGTLLIAEPMADTAGARAMGDAYFGFYLLAMGSGRPRTEARLAELLRMAGFSASKRIATKLPLQTSILIAS